MTRLDEIHYREELSEEKKPEYAKMVYSLDFQREIDRTDTTILQNPHVLGIFDIDFRCESASNQQARNWTYAGTERTQEKARDKIEKQMKKQLPFDTEYRIVNAETGEVLEKIN